MPAIRAINPFAAPLAHTETLLSEKEPIRIETRETTIPAPPTKTGLRFVRPKFSLPFNTSPKVAKVQSLPEINTQDQLKPPQSVQFRPPSPQIPTLSLPTINLTTATGEKSKMEDLPKPLTLFQPPTPAEARRIARQHAAFGPLGSKQHLYTSRFEGPEFPEPIEDEPPYYFLITTYISYLVSLYK